MAATKNPPIHLVYVGNWWIGRYENIWSNVIATEDHARAVRYCNEMAKKWNTRLIVHEPE